MWWQTFFKLTTKIRKVSQWHASGCFKDVPRTEVIYKIRWAIKARMFMQHSDSAQIGKPNQNLLTNLTSTFVQSTALNTYKILSLNIIFRLHLHNLFAYFIYTFIQSSAFKIHSQCVLSNSNSYDFGQHPALPNEIQEHLVQTLVCLF